MSTYCLDPQNFAVSPVVDWFPCLGNVTLVVILYPQFRHQMTGPEVAMVYICATHSVRLNYMYLQSLEKYGSSDPV